MQRAYDPFEHRQTLRGPFTGSLALHLSVLGALALSAWLTNRVRQPWGDPASLGGGSVAITPVSRIPIAASSGPVNPVANDTRSQVPAPPKPEPRRAAKDDPAAIALKSRGAPREKAAPRLDARYKQPEPQENQLHSSAGQAAASPMFGLTPGSAGVGVGTGAPFGARFGAYTLLVRDRVAQKWRTDAVDPRVSTAPPVIVTFEILRNGAVRDARILQRSGHLTLDNSALRAILEAAPFPELPAGYSGNAAVIEFWFQLKR